MADPTGAFYSPQQAPNPAPGEVDDAAQLAYLHHLSTLLSPWKTAVAGGLIGAPYGGAAGGLASLGNPLGIGLGMLGGGALGAATGYRDGLRRQADYESYKDQLQRLMQQTSQGQQ